MCPYCRRKATSLHLHHILDLILASTFQIPEQWGLEGNWWSAINYSNRNTTFATSCNQWWTGRSPRRHSLPVPPSPPALFEPDFASGIAHTEPALIILALQPQAGPLPQPSSNVPRLCTPRRSRHAVQRQQTGANFSTQPPPTPSHAPPTKVPVFIADSLNRGASAVPLLVQHHLHPLKLLHLTCHLLVKFLFPTSEAFSNVLFYSAIRQQFCLIADMLGKGEWDCTPNGSWQFRDQGRSSHLHRARARRASVPGSLRWSQCTINNAASISKWETETQLQLFYVAGIF